MGNTGGSGPSADGEEGLLNFGPVLRGCGLGQPDCQIRSFRSRAQGPDRFHRCPAHRGAWVIEAFHNCREGFQNVPLLAKIQKSLGCDACSFRQAGGQFVIDILAPKAVQRGLRSGCCGGICSSRRIKQDAHCGGVAETVQHSQSKDLEVRGAAPGDVENLRKNCGILPVG